MHTPSKAFYAILFLGILGALFPFPAAMAKEDATKPPPIYNTPKKDSNGDEGKMKSMSWETPEPEQKVETKEAPPEKESGETPDEKKQAGQELWEKYKQLAGGKKTGENAENEDESSDDQSSEAEAQKQDEKEAADTKEKSEGLKQIIEDYKNAQKNKGKMNSRSFGDIN